MPKQRQLILEIHNHHVDSAPKIDIEDGSYVSYFENTHGDQWIFVRARDADTATVYGGDLGWEGLEVWFRTSQQIREELAKAGARESTMDQLIAMSNPDPLVPTTVLNAGEKAWLNAAWWASSKRSGQKAEMRKIAESIASKVPADGMEQHPNSTAYRTAHQFLTLIVGREAGMRGMVESQVADLFEEVLKVIDGD